MKASKSALKANLCIFSAVIILVISAHISYAQDRYWAPKDPPKSHYVIDVKIDLVKGAIEGREKIFLRNSALKPINIIAFAWSVNEKSSIEVLSAGEPPAMLNIAAGAPTAPLLFYNLPEPLLPGSKVELDVNFQLLGNFSSGDDEIELTHWHPRLWWNHLSVHDSYDVKIDIPHGYAAAVSGLLNQETGRYENDGVELFGIYLGKGLKTESRLIEGVLVTALFTEKGEQCAKLCLDTAVDVISFYKNWLGFYPFKFFYIIPGVPDRPIGGWAYATGIVGIHGQEAFEKETLQHWKWITAHEVGHQYWGEYVMDPDLAYWLWISLGIYADREYMISRNLGLDQHKELMSRYLSGLRMRYNTTIDVPWELLIKTNFDRGNIVTHGKGFSLISALECLIGKEAFERAYKRCLREYGGRRLGYSDFQKVCEEESGEDLDYFFLQWVNSNRYPCFVIESQDCRQEGDKFVSEVRIKRAGTLEMPVPVKAVFEDGTSQLKLTQQAFEVTTLVFESKAGLKNVLIDPEEKIAMLDKPLPEIPKELADALAFGIAEDDTENALIIYKNLKLLDPIEDYRFYNSLGSALFAGRHYAEAFDAFSKLDKIAPNDRTKFMALAWMGLLKDLLEERAAALGYYNEALKLNIDLSLSYKQWGFSIDRQWVEERLKTAFKLDTPLSDHK